MAARAGQLSQRGEPRCPRTRPLRRARVVHVVISEDDNAHINRHRERQRERETSREREREREISYLAWRRRADALAIDHAPKKLAHTARDIMP